MTELTFVEAIHIKLSHERRDISVLEVLTSSGQRVREGNVHLMR